MTRLQVTTNRNYLLKFPDFTIDLTAAKTVPITEEQADTLEADSGIKSLIDSGEIIIHREKDDSIQPSGEKRRVRTNSVEDAG